MKIFVAGATGVVGRRAVPALVAAGHRVTAAGRNPERMSALARAGAAVVGLDLFDREAVARAVAGCDVVVNLATHIPSSPTRMLLPGGFRENDRLRREAAAMLAQAAVAGGVRRVVQESFAPIYADGGDAWLDERAPVRPAPHTRTTLDAERAAESMTRSGGAGVVLRYAWFYGPDSSAQRDLIGMIAKGWAPVPGGPDAYWSSISHDDAASAVIAALDLPAGIYNVCDDEPLPRRAYVDALASAFGYPSPKLPPMWTTKLMGSLGETMARSLRMSNAKLRAHGWTPRYPSAREGFAAMRAGDVALKAAG